MNKLGLLLLASFLALPVAANAQIYKWKDKDGSVRYSDTPPPGNVPHESLGGRKAVVPKPTGEVPVTETQPAPAAAETKPKETPEQAKERQQTEEANLKIKQQNCATARANLNTFEQGGRISRMNEQGEREYFDDAGLAREAEKARKEVAEFCS
jgi:hypothetical protein